MTTKELIDYVEGELKKGGQKDAIKSRLLQNGWSSNDIEETFGIIEGKTVEAESISAPIFPLPTSSSFWDFIHKKTYKNHKERIYDLCFGFFNYLFFTILFLYFLPMTIPDFVIKYDTGFVFLPGFYTLLTFGLFVYLLLKRKYIALGIIFAFLIPILIWSWILWALGGANGHL